MSQQVNHLKAQKGQSAVEYLFLVAAVILVILAFLNPTGAFRNTVETSVNQDVEMVDVMVNEFNILP